MWGALPSRYEVMADSQVADEAARLLAELADRQDSAT
jgi:hypothetical protein